MPVPLVDGPVVGPLLPHSSPPAPPPPSRGLFSLVHEAAWIMKMPTQSMHNELILRMGFSLRFCSDYPVGAVSLLRRYPTACATPSPFCGQLRKMRGIRHEDA